MKIKKILCLAPPYYDFLCATIIDGFKQLGYDLSCNAQTNNAGGKEYVAPEDLLPCCRASDIIFLFSNTDYAHRKKLITDHGFTGKTVYIDGSDFVGFEDLDGG